MNTAPAHKTGRRRKNRRHAGQEDFTGLALIMTFLVLILASLVLLPFLPWGALVTLVSTGVISVVMGRRLAHHPGDHWRSVSVPAEPVTIEGVRDDVVEPTHILSPEGVEVLESHPRVVHHHHHHHRKLTPAQWKMAGWVVIGILWLRNTRDHRMLDDDRLTT